MLQSRIAIYIVKYTKSRSNLDWQDHLQAHDNNWRI